MSETTAPESLPGVPRPAGWNAARGATVSGRFSRLLVWSAVLVMAAVMLAAAIHFAASQRWGAFWLTLLVLFTVVSPTATRRWMPVKPPAGLEAGIALFVFATLFLGEIADFYERFEWWDLLLHAGSGVLFGAIGLLFCHLLLRRAGAPDRSGSALAYSFATMLAMSVGTFWEIFEFALQSASGLPVQVPQLSDASGLTDTMGDLIMNALGALGFAVMDRWRLRRETSARPGWVSGFLLAYPAFLRGRGHAAPAAGGLSAGKPASR